MSSTDLKVLDAAQHKAKRLAPLLELVSWPGYTPQSHILPAGVIGLWIAAGRPREAVWQLLAWSCALIAPVVHHAYPRKRPPLVLSRHLGSARKGGSFPSGHVLAYVGFYGFTIYLIATTPHRPKVFTALAAVLLVMIALIGLARVDQGDHWPSDVLGGYLVGGVFLVGIVAAHQTAESLGIASEGWDDDD